MCFQPVRQLDFRRETYERFERYHAVFCCKIVKHRTLTRDVEITTMSPQNGTNSNDYLYSSALIDGKQNWFVLIEPSSIYNCNCVFKTSISTWRSFTRKGNSVQMVGLNVVSDSNSYATHFANFHKSSIRSAVLAFFFILNLTFSSSSLRSRNTEFGIDIVLSLLISRTLRGSSSFVSFKSSFPCQHSLQTWHLLRMA